MADIFLDDHCISLYINYDINIKIKKLSVHTERIILALLIVY